MTDTPLSFRYSAVDRTGRQFNDVVKARDAREAARLLQAEGLTPIRLAMAPVAQKREQKRNLRFPERVSVLRQLALMISAGVGLLEAVQTVAEGVPVAKAREQLVAVGDALRQGQPLAASLQNHAPGYPFYVYAMCTVGEATGRVGEVLRTAAEQMSYEDRLRREVVNALTYPAFLLSAGFSAVLFIFTQVVPRFSVMIGDKRDKMPAISKLVLGVGEEANSHLPIVLVGIGAVIAASVAAISNARVRGMLYDSGLRLPLIGPLLRAREITTWARITGFALGHDVVLLEALSLARQAAPRGAFARGLEQLDRDLRGGDAMEVSLGRNTALTAMDLSLLRTGQKSGTLPAMFGYLADTYDDRLKDALKRLTALVEPISIGAISILVGVVALSLVLALSSVYDSVF